MHVVRKKCGEKLEFIGVEKLHFTAWLNSQVPKDGRFVEHVQGLQVNIYYNASGEEKVNDKAARLLATQSKNHTALLPRGCVVFAGFDQNGISAKDYEELEQMLK